MSRHRRHDEVVKPRRAFCVVRTVRAYRPYREYRPCLADPCCPLAESGKSRGNAGGTRKFSVNGHTYPQVLGIAGVTLSRHGEALQGSAKAQWPVYLTAPILVLALGLPAVREGHHTLGRRQGHFPALSQPLTAIGAPGWPNCGEAEANGRHVCPVLNQGVSGRPRGYPVYPGPDPESKAGPPECVCGCGERVVLRYKALYGLYVLCRIVRICSGW